MRMSALRRSLRVPPERILRRKARSDAEPPVAFGKAENVESSDACKEEARSSRVVTWDADWKTTGTDAVESGGIKLNQSGDAGTSSLALEDEDRDAATRSYTLRFAQPLFNAQESHNQVPSA